MHKLLGPKTEGEEKEIQSKETERAFFFSTVLTCRIYKKHQHCLQFRQINKSSLRAHHQQIYLYEMYAKGFQPILFERGSPRKKESEVDFS